MELSLFFSAEMYVGDYQGDNLDDIFCRDASGNMNVSVTRIQRKNMDAFQAIPFCLLILFFVVRRTSISVAASKVEFIAIDFPLTGDVRATELFCVDKDLFVGDVNGDQKYKTILKSFQKSKKYILYHKH